MTGLRCAIYTRVSTDEQADTGYSLAAQMTACEALAASRGWEIAARYVDAGYSGGKTDRPEWQRMQADARLRRFDILIVHKLDRFSRDVVAGLGVIETLRNQGVSFISVSEQFDLTSPMGGVMLTMLLAFAQLYRENLRAEVHKGKLQRAKSGLSNGNKPPYGYRRVDGRDVVVPEEAALWRQAVQRFIDGASDLEVSDWLNAQGATLPSGKSFSRVVVREMMINPHYTGRVRWRGLRDEKNPQGDRLRRLRRETELYPGQHEPIVPLDLWVTAERVRRARSTGGGGLRRRAYLLLGMARCAACGSRLTAVPRGSSRHARYECRAYERGVQCPCPRRSVTEPALQAQVDAVMARLDLDDAVLREASELAEIDDPQQATARRAAAIADEQQRLDIMFQRGRLPVARWESEHARLQADLDALASAAPPANSVEIASLLDAWRAAADDLADQHAILSVILSHVDVDLESGRVTQWHARPAFAAAIARAVAQSEK